MVAANCSSIRSCTPRGVCRLSWHCPRLPQGRVQQQGTIFRSSSASADLIASSPISSPIRVSDRSPTCSPDRSPVGGYSGSWQFTKSAKPLGYPVRHYSSDLQSHHPAPKLAPHETTVGDVSNKSAVTQSELQEVFAALESHKKEQHVALRAIKSELDARISKLEETIHPMHCSLQALQSQRGYEQQLNDMLKTAKNELMQVKRDLLTALASSISSNVNQLCVGDLVPILPPSTTDSSTPCSNGLNAKYFGIAALPTANIKKPALPITENLEWELTHTGQARPIESGSKTHDAQGLLSTMCVGGKLLEQNLDSPSGNGKALQYIMDNSFRLERAAFGLAPGSAECPHGIKYGDHDSSKIDSKDEADNDYSESHEIIRLQPEALHH